MFLLSMLQEKGLLGLISLFCIGNTVSGNKFSTRLLEYKLGQISKKQDRAVNITLTLTLLVSGTSFVMFKAYTIHTMRS